MFGRVHQDYPAVYGPGASGARSDGSTEEKFCSRLLLTGTDVEMTPDDPKYTKCIQSDKMVLLTSQAIQAWFMTATWHRIRAKGHGFWIKETDRTQIELLLVTP